MSVITRGDREISARFEAFPQRAKAKLQERIGALTAQLEERVREAAPHKSGQLRSEVKLSMYSGQNRVAGYVSIYAGDNSKEYAKAATLEYGTDKPRRIPDHGGIFRRLGAGQKRIESRLTNPARIQAFRYLRGPLDQMKSEIEASLDEGIAEAIAESEA
jgi:hypothetical protein